MDNPDFTPSQVGGLFTFLARQLAKPDNTLFVNRKLFDQVTNQIVEYFIRDHIILIANGAGYCMGAQRKLITKQCSYVC